jgi:hypothetical protein
MGVLSVLFACYGGRGGGMGGGGGLWQLNLDYTLHDFHLELETEKTRKLQREWARVAIIGCAKTCAI